MPRVRLSPRWEGGRLRAGGTLDRGELGERRLRAAGGSVVQRRHARQRLEPAQLLEQLTRRRGCKRVADAVAELRVKVVEADRVARVAAGIAHAITCEHRAVG